MTLGMCACNVQSAVNNIVSSSSKTCSDEVVTRQLDVAGVQSLSLYTGVKAQYTQSPTTSATLYIKKHVEKDLEVKYSGSRLSVGLKSNEGEKRHIEDVVLVITAPDICEFKLSSAASLEMEAPYSVTKELDVNLSSAASFTAQSVEASKIDFDLSSSSKCNIQSVKASKVDLDLSSSANATLHAVTANEVEAALSSSSKCTFNAVNSAKIDIDASSASSLTMNAIDAEMVEASSTSASKIYLEGSTQKAELSASSAASIEAESLSAYVGSISASSAGSVISHIQKVTTNSSSGGRVANRP